MFPFLQYIDRLSEMKTRALKFKYIYIVLCDSLLECILNQVGL